MATGTRSGENLALTVHGPAGILDLLVPAGAVAADVAREYAEQSGLPSIPLLYTRLGTPLLPDVPLEDAGVDAGDVLVATTSIHRSAAAAPRHPWHAETTGEPGALSVLWFCVAVGAAVLAGWLAAHTPSETVRNAAVYVLAGAALLGLLPLGRFAAHRALAAPAFAASAGFALAWDPHPERLPTVLGVAALTGGVTAAVARSLDRRNEEALRVWITVGVGIFLITAAAALGGLPPRLSWAVLLVATMLAARFVPSFAVDVPDQYLLDLERLAVTAWSARDRPGGRRGRTVVNPAAVAAVAARGTRMVTASCVAVLVVASVAAPLLLASTPLTIDRIGARCLVFFSGCGLLLAARAYRHVAARALLRAAGLVSLAALAQDVLRTLGAGRTASLAGAAIVLATILVVAAVATGRGWRSAWWSRRAEVAEALCGSAAVASVVVASGGFRSLWESIHIQV